VDNMDGVASHIIYCDLIIMLVCVGLWLVWDDILRRRHAMEWCMRLPLFSSVCKC
jgi:type II secretory pathway component PulF